MKKKNILFFVLVLFYLGVTAQQSGTLDPSFGNMGIVSTNAGSGGGGLSVLVQPDGKIVMGGIANYNFGIFRYNTNGTLDNSFGTGGKVYIDFGASDYCQSVLYQPDGKILAVGSFTDDYSTFSKIALARMNTDGSLDNTFGTAGKVITTVGTFDFIYSAVLDDAGKIIVGGAHYNGSGSDFLLVRYLSDGGIDSTFGTNGIVITSFGTDAQGLSVALQPDGKIIAAGAAGPYGYADFAMARYLSDGTPDAGFGTAGLLTVNMGQNDSISDIELQPDGKIVAAGNSSQMNGTLDIVLARFNADGSLDAGFGNSGKVVSDFGDHDWCFALALQQNGKILAGGSITLPGLSWPQNIVRYNSDGSIDNSFGQNGIAINNTNAGFMCNSMALQPDGKIITGGYSNNYSVARYYGEGNITGIVYNDENGNGVFDTSEQGIAGQMIRLDPGPYFTFTGNDGQYNLAAQGSGTVSIVGQQYWILTTDSTNYHYNLTDSVTDYSGFDFGMQALMNIHDLSVDITASQARPSVYSTFWLNFRNNGTATEQGTVSVDFCNLLTGISSNITPDIQAGSHYEWNFDTLASGETRMIILHAMNADVSYLGDTLISFSQIIPVTGDTCIENNYDTLKQVLMGSYDPNDKTVVPAGIDDAGYVVHGQELTYTIRFQNTGNDTAFTVVILDTLDADLDAGSFHYLASSHNVNFAMEGQQILRFTFNNILLPDSNTNESASHGFIKFSINPKQSLADYTEVENTAFIYFDANPPVATNTVLNTFVSASLMGIAENENTDGVIIFPNPANDIITLNISGFKGSTRLEIYNITGQLMQQQQINNENKMMDVSRLNSGIYFVKVKTDKGVTVKKFVKE
jgi:uncharacterized delta-60 repeat protein/uncharacterized repeat protein (TIGR01451 family)